MSQMGKDWEIWVAKVALSVVAFVTESRISDRHSADWLQAVAAAWPPYTDVGPTDQATACLKCATMPSAHLHLHSLSLFSTVQAEAGRG